MTTLDRDPLGVIQEEQPVSDFKTRPALLERRRMKAADVGKQNAAQLFMLRTTQLQPNAPRVARAAVHPTYSSEEMKKRAIAKQLEKEANELRSAEVELTFDNLVYILTCGLFGTAPVAEEEQIQTPVSGKHISPVTPPKAHHLTRRRSLLGQHVVIA